MTNKKIGVGIVGAGPVSQAVHLPTLGLLSEDYTVVHIMDADADIAERAARQVKARFTNDLATLMADAEVDVVAICSPPQFHVEQVFAAIDAGKKGILCEKPLAASSQDANALRDALTQAGIPLIVGAMHAMDPGWLAARNDWLATGDTARHIRVTTVLPPNSNYETTASEMIAQSPNFSFEPKSREDEANGLRGAVLGLAVHSVPLVRQLAEGQLSVVHAQLLPPLGYEIIGTIGDASLEFIAVGQSSSLMQWEIFVQGDSHSMTVVCPPSYVHAGSISSSIESLGETRVRHKLPENGYVTEWRKLARYVQGSPQAKAELDSYLEDLEFTLALADQSASLALSKEKF